MSVRIAEGVSIELRQAVEGKPPSSEVIISGHRTGTFVGGAVLEAAVECDGRLLLFMTDDTPFEETLSIHLLSENGSVLDSARLGGPYTTGSFTALMLQQPNRVGFRFIGDVDWVVEVLAEAAFRLPLAGDPPGIRRPLGFSRHFVVHRERARLS